MQFFHLQQQTKQNNEQEASGALNNQLASVLYKIMGIVYMSYSTETAKMFCINICIFLQKRSSNDIVTH